MINEDQKIFEALVHDGCRVILEKVRGYLLLHLINEYGQGKAVVLSADQARDLGGALTDWAGRKRLRIEWTERDQELNRAFAVPFEPADD